MTLIIPLLAILLLYAVSLLREIMSVAFPGSVTLHVAPHVRPHPQFLPLMNAGSTAAVRRNPRHPRLLHHRQTCPLLHQRRPADAGRPLARS